MARENDRRFKWTEKQENLIRRLYPKLGPKRLAANMDVSVDGLMGKAVCMGVRMSRTFVWTQATESIVRERYVKEGPTKLAEELGITPFMMTAKARRLGIGSTRKTPPKGFRWTKRMIAAIEKRYVAEGGRSLAREFGVVIDTVRRKAVSMGLRTIAGHKEWGEIRADLAKHLDVTYFTRWSPNMAYVLGFMFADGCVNKNLGSVSVVQHERGRSVLEFIKEELRSTGRIYASKDSLMLVLSSTVLVRTLLDLGLRPRKTYNDDPFPEIPDEMTPHFIRGYLDGDGWVWNGPGFCGSPKFIIGLRDALVHLAGMRTALVSIKQGKTAPCATVHWGALEDVKAFYSFAYPEGFGFCLERKRKKFAEWLSKPRWARGHYYPRKNVMAFN